MKKIMFNDKYGLTQAVLEGRKTMTRRIVPQCILDAAKKYQKEYYEGALEHISLEDAIMNMVGPERMFQRDVYHIDEIVAIAQNYDVARLDMSEQQIEDLTYADMKHLFYHKKKMPGFTNKMFVKAEWMPHHIQITGIRVQNLQDISDEDCLKEGVVKAWIGYYVPGLKANWVKESHIETENGQTWKLFPTPQEAFAALIDKVSGKGTWESNPLVWVYEFKLID